MVTAILSLPRVIKVPHYLTGVLPKLVCRFENVNNFPREEFKNLLKYSLMLHCYFSHSLDIEIRRIFVGLRSWIADISLSI